MNFLEEIVQTGPKDIYEVAVITHDQDEAMEFLVGQCQVKDQIIQFLSRTLRNELGSGWWQKYVDEVKDNSLARLEGLTSRNFNDPDFFPRVKTLMDEPSNLIYLVPDQLSDIPL
jgi:hypothetical protein